MPKIQNYHCEKCDSTFEYMHMGSDDPATCECGSGDVTIQLGGVTLTTIVPAHRTSLRNKAGYVHTHGDRPAEKISSAVPRSFKG